MAIPGLSAEEVRLIHRSVGWGTHKIGRPLSPIEIGDLLDGALNKGATLQVLAAELPITASNLSRFLRVAKLPSDVRHMVTWGSVKGTLGYTTAVEIARISDLDDQRALARAVIERDMTTPEVRQAVQLRRRSLKAIAECIDESIGMRPTVERRYVFVGAVTAPDQVSDLRSLSQNDRNKRLAAALSLVGLNNVSGTLGEELFTLVGSEASSQQLSGAAAESLEERVTNALRQVQTNG